MKKYELGVLLAGLLGACTSNKPRLTDAPAVDSGPGVCNVLTQTGCPTGEKCTWLHDATTPNPLGHIGCAPNGTAQLGATCTYGPDGAVGYDTCAAGLVCQGKCKTICDQQGGAPMCTGNFACSTYEGLFGPVGQPVAAGVCDPSCDPLTDNNFKGSAGTKTGSACPQANVGCYGYPDSKKPTQWSCTGEVLPMLVHRSQCTTASGCANTAGNPYLNGCAQGYLPLLLESSGSTTVVCTAICAPGNTYMNNTPQYPAGRPGNACNNNDRRGSFMPTATTTLNGEHCMFSWDFEIDTMGKFVRSPTSDTVGFCLDHTKYQYDSNKNGMIDPGDIRGWPLCASLPKNGSGSGSAHVFGADDFACVDTAAAMLPFNGKTSVENRTLVERPRMLYHRMMKE